MEPTLENTVKANNNMTKLREAAAKNPALKDAFAVSMYPIKDLLANRVKSMKLNENYVQCFPAAPEERIQHFSGVIQQRIDPLISSDIMMMPHCQKLKHTEYSRKTLHLNFIHVSNKEMYPS